jgi:ADP-ribose pyrophosphatase YjhB (NUDIX family)
MLLWLLKTECKVPPFGTHHCGVGCVMVKDDDKSILVVREKARVYLPHWKLPGGYVSLGEDFSKAAEREVFEETGVRYIPFQCSDISLIYGSFVSAGPSFKVF